LEEQVEAKGREAEEEERRLKEEAGREAQLLRGRIEEAHRERDEAVEEAQATRRRIEEAHREGEEGVEEAQREIESLKRRIEEAHREHAAYRQTVEVSMENRGKMAAIGMTFVLVCGPDPMLLV
jgi:predicted RNase H-like nuclease (RuvC/YqgF family)